MFALIFTNTVLGAYLSYILAEKKRNSFKEKSFWAILFLLAISVIITFYTIVSPESIESVKETMLP